MKVVHVAQIVRHGLILSNRLQETLDRSGPPGARQTGHVDVEPKLLDRQAKFQRPDGPFLADDDLEWRHVRRRLTTQGFRIPDRT